MLCNNVNVCDVTVPRYNGRPHGLFSIDSELQSVVVLRPSLQRQLVVNITRTEGLHGSVRVHFALRYDQVFFHLWRKTKKTPNRCAVEPPKGVRLPDLPCLTLPSSLPQAGSKTASKMPEKVYLRKCLGFFQLTKRWICNLKTTSHSKGFYHIHVLQLYRGALDDSNWWNNSERIIISLPVA